MRSPQPIFSKEEFARRGDEIYERAVLPQLKPGDKGKFVAIDIQTEAFEIDRDELAASDRILAKLPNAQTWLSVSALAAFGASAHALTRRYHDHRYRHCCPRGRNQSNCARSK
jgi:hypothetical protein